MVSAVLVAEDSTAVGEVPVDKASVGSPGKSVAVGVVVLWTDDKASVLTPSVAEGGPLSIQLELIFGSEEHFDLCEDMVVGLGRQDDPVGEG